MMTNNEQAKLDYYRTLAERFLDDGLIWCNCTGPTGWASMGIDAPVYAWEIDVEQISASRLLKAAPKFIHDAETALRGQVKVGFKNSVGFCVYFDERGYQDIDILAELAKLKYALIWGSTDTGKTTLVAHLIEATGWETIALYPKKLNPDKLPHGVAIKGAGGNWAELEATIDNLVLQMYNRDETSEPLFIVADDFRLWVREARSLAERLFHLVNVGRESNIFVYILNQTNSVKGNALDGEGNLREAFAQVHLSKIKDKRFGTIDFGDGNKFRFDHPGAWEPKTQAPKPKRTIGKNDLILAKFAAKKNSDNCGIDALFKLIKSELKPGWWRGDNAPFTRWKIQKRLEDWSAKGWTEDAGHRKQRRISAKLKTIANL